MRYLGLGQCMGDLFAAKRNAKTIAFLMMLFLLPQGGVLGSDMQKAAEALRTSVQDSTSLSDEQKKQAGARIDEAIAADRQGQTVFADIEALRKRIASAAERLGALSRDLADSPEADVAESVAKLTDEQLELQAAERRGLLTIQQQALEESERRLDQVLAQGLSDASDLATIAERLGELESLPLPEFTEGALASVDELWRSARMALLRGRIDLLNLRQGSINQLTDLARLERDVALAKVDAINTEVSALAAEVQARRQREAEAVVSAVEQQGSDTSEVLRKIKAQISPLAREQSQLLVQEAEITRQLSQVKRTAERLERDYERIQQVVELGGASGQVSSLLQKRRQLAPSPDQLGRESLVFQQKISDAGLRQLELDEDLQEIIDDDSARTFLLASAGVDSEGLADPKQLEALQELAGIYRQAVLDLWQGYTRYLNALSQIEAGTRSLALEASRYHAFIDDRLLWLPSAELIPLTDPRLLWQGVNWFVDDEYLDRVSADLATLLADEKLRLAIWVLVVIALLLLQARARAGLRDAAELTRKVRTDSFYVTFKALLYTIGLVALVPSVLIGSGILLGGLHNASDVGLRYGAGLQAAGQTMLFLSLLRQLCREHGVALFHSQWTPVLVEQLHRQLGWLIPVVVPFAFFVGIGSASVPSNFIQLASALQTENPGLVALGRLAFAAQMVFLLVAIHRIWRKEGAVMKEFAASEDNNRWASYHVFWFGPALLAPLTLGVSALAGYYYTGVFLTSVAGETLWLILLIVLVRDLLFRGLYVAQRRLRFQEALRYRDESIAQRESGEGKVVASESPAEGVIKAIEEEKVNYRQLGEEVRSLVQLGYTFALIVGLWWIWRDIFPAFSFLNQVQLPITTTKLVDGVEQDVALTLSELVAGLLLGGLAMFAAMKVPAVLELTLLQRLPMSRASRYAFTTLLQYAVAMAGVFIAFDALGLQWSSIQWLVAALSVGLGFGLQEIVANFISGIILLFEQPIRVGDVVTVDGTTGTVSKIRIRATTIVNWERQELVIPNKTFITGQLINWTLSDTVNRIYVTVGVSYDTDTRVAMKLMHEVAEEHHNIVADPVHRITFEGFGDNALTLNMRAFLGDMETRLQTISEVHQAILDKFRDAGIEIAFPQRDVHLSTTKPLEMVWRRGGP